MKIKFSTVCCIGAKFPSRLHKLPRLDGLLLLISSAIQVFPYWSLQCRSQHKQNWRVKQCKLNRNFTSDFILDLVVQLPGFGLHHALNISYIFASQPNYGYVKRTRFTFLSLNHSHSTPKCGTFIRTRLKCVTVGIASVKGKIVLSKAYTAV